MGGRLGVERGDPRDSPGSDWRLLPRTTLRSLPGASNVAALLEPDALVEIELEAEVPADGWDAAVLTG